jgi:hypothetical protein
MGRLKQGAGLFCGAALLAGASVVGTRGSDNHYLAQNMQIDKVLSRVRAWTVST